MNQSLTNQDGEKNCRAQAVVIDALPGAIFLIGVVSIAIISTGLTPMQVAQPGEQDIDGEIERDATAAIAASEQDGSLKATILAWDQVDDDEDTGEFNDGETPTVIDGAAFADYPATAFGDRLEQIESEYDISGINVKIVPHEPDTASSIDMIDTTPATGDAIVITQTVRLDEEDKIQSEAEYHSNRGGAVMAGGINTDEDTLTESPSYPVENAADDLGSDGTYNIVDVQVFIHDL